MSFSDYCIKVIDYKGDYRFQLIEFQTLSVMETLNGMGAWKITHRTYDKCPFQPNDGVVIYRKDIQIFCGIIDTIDEEYHFPSKTWKWTVSGKGYNSVLAWRYITPSGTASRESSTRYLTFDESTASVAKDLIDSNAKYIPAQDDQLFLSIQSSGGAIRVYDTGSPMITPSYRFENLYDTVIGLLSGIEFSLTPVWNETSKKIFFWITPDRDRTSTVIFRDYLGEIRKCRHISNAPDASHVLTSFNGDESYDPYGEIWKYAVAKDIPGNYSGWMNGTARHTFYEPNKDDFGDNPFTPATLQNICIAEAYTKYVMSDGYEIEIDPVASPYSYGYKLDDDDFDFVTDYKIGDKIAVEIFGETFTGKVTKMEYSVSYGQESIKSVIGVQKKGAFGGILADLANLNKSVNKKKNAEV